MLATINTTLIALLTPSQAMALVTASTRLLVIAALEDVMCPSSNQSMDSLTTSAVTFRRLSAKPVKLPVHLQEEKKTYSKYTH